MPFKSEAQRRKFGEMVKQGKMTKEEFEKWNSETPKKIPERLGAPNSTDDIRKIAKAKMVKKI